MDREDSLRAFSEYNNKKACINWQPQKTLVRFLCLESDLPQSRKQTTKKELQENCYAATGKQGEGGASGASTNVKRNHPGNSCQHKETGWRRSQGSHPLRWHRGAAVKSLLETRKLHHAQTQGSADCWKTGTSTTCSASNHTPILVGFPEETKQLHCSPVLPTTVWKSVGQI